MKYIHLVLRTHDVITEYVTTGARSRIKMDPALQLIMEQFDKLSTELNAGQEAMKNYIERKTNKHRPGRN